MNSPTWFRDLSLRRKHIVIAFLATVTAMFFAILLSTLMQWFMLREELVKNVTAQATIIAANSTAYLNSNNRSAADRLVRSLAGIDNIEFAGILDKAGKNFALYVRPGITIPDHVHQTAQNKDHLHTVTYIEIALPVVYNREQIGLIHVRSDMTPVYNNLEVNLLITLIAATGAFVVAVLMLMRLLPTIIDPMQHLIRLMDAISHDNNFSRRAQLHGNDEMGLLAKGFNGMLTQLQLRDEALAQHRRQLEEKVDQRTKELRESNSKLEKELIEHKIAEKELTNANEQLSILLNSLPIAVYRCRAEGDFAVMYMSQNVISFTGYTPEEFMAQTDLWSSRIHPDDAPEIFGAMELLFEKGTYTNEYRWMNSAGNFIWLQDSLKLIQPEDGSPAYMVGMWQDITAQKNAQKMLHESELAYRTLAHNLPGLVYRVFVRENNNMEFYNDMMVETTGYTADEMKSGTVCSIEPLIVDEDRPAVMDEVTHAIKMKRPFRIEYRLKHKNGTIHWMEEHGMPVYDTEGTLLYIDGLIFDVTERKYIEQELEESEAKFRTILDVAVDGVLLMDKEKSKFILANRAICEMLGYRPDELYDLGITDIHPEESLPEVFRQFERQARGEILVAQNLPVKRKDGSVFIADVSSAPMTLAGRTIMVGFFHDVTERKRIEEKMQLLATTDTLTGIANRREFNRHLIKEIERAKRYDIPLSLIMYDIDYFKQVNDTFGHDVGDDVLQAITEVVMRNIRAVDIPARWGGEEFMILMPESDLSAASEVAEKLRKEVAAQPFEHVGSLTVSFGVTEFSLSDDANALLKRVDDALYKAKQNGRNCVESL